MKTIIRNATVLFLALFSLQGKTQTFSICAGSSTVVTAINSSGLTSPSYSMNPGGITSSNATFTVAPTSATSYTLYVTGTNSSSAVVTTSNVVNVTVHSVSYTPVSPQSFTLGCATKSVCMVLITSATSFPATGNPLTYTFLPPGSSTVLPAGTLSSITNVTMTTAGSWSVVVRDNINQCDGWTALNIISNTLSPNISATVPQQILDCTTPSLQLQGNSSTPNVSMTWSGSGSVPGNIQAVNTNTTAPTSTLIANYSLTVTDNNSTCESMSVVPMFQNIFKPNVVISDGGVGTNTIVCTHSVILTNASSTGIPYGTFPTSSPVAGYLWEGPSPQTSLALSTTYLAQTTGIYTLTAMDLNNGCTNTATHVVYIGPKAAFVHTVSGGQAVFNDATISSITNLTYYWDFGDGNTSNLQNPTHYYLNGGAYLVKFKVSAGIFCSDSMMQSVTISGVPCVANSNFSLMPTGTAQVWNAVPSYPWNVSAAVWSWGDGSFSNALYTSHQYATAGMYNICLSVTLSCVASSSTCTSYSVYRASSQEALMLQVNVMAPELVAGILSSDAENKTEWNIFPNPNTGEFNLSIQNPEINAVHLVISDLSGRIVYDQKLSNTSGSVSVKTSDLPSGMYFLSIDSGQSKSTKRFIVNK